MKPVQQTPSSFTKRLFVACSSMFSCGRVFHYRLHIIFFPSISLPCSSSCRPLHLFLLFLFSFLLIHLIALPLDVIPLASRRSLRLGTAFPSSQAPRTGCVFAANDVHGFPAHLAINLSATRRSNVSRGFLWSILNPPPGSLGSAMFFLLVRIRLHALLCGSRKVFFI